MARFLDGKLVKAVWSQLQNERGEWKPAALIICTDTKISAEAIIQAYARRWSIETAFNQLKLAWGMKECWQQSKQVLMRWMHLMMAGYGLVQLLTCLKASALAKLSNHSPWRQDHPTTAGHLRRGLVRDLMHVNVRGWWHPKDQKFEPRDYENSG
ncbi:hypothetical protein [Pelagibaculum spongiae]|uniref:Transposase IS4-like domain-containing protein n=1 Tax=Pelagibaculum spongiae TaxID=2080658 RepID=A0A2V1GZ02_9GAMM|nr:hypothetical protein [Pelagibaculum spongiae]PVZ68286.1 hypothetical protein DC094_13435 [Pelagibaculum spongiae]